MQVEPDLLGGVSDTCRWSQSGWEGYETYVVGAKVVGMVRGQSRWSQSGGEVYGKHEGGDRVVGMVRGHMQVEPEGWGWVCDTCR